MRPSNFIAASALPDEKMAGLARIWRVQATSDRFQGHARPRRPIAGDALVLPAAHPFEIVSLSAPPFKTYVRPRQLSMGRRGAMYHEVYRIRAGKCCCW